MSANSAPATGKTSRLRVVVAVKPCNSAWKSNHSLTKPLRSGRPEIAAAPTRKNSAVHGIRLARPPIPSSCRVPVAITTPPALRNSKPLKRAWLSTWKRLAAIPTAASSGRPTESAIIPAPNPSRMIPTFSMVLYASMRLRSFCVSAYSTPRIAVSEPTAASVIPQSQRGTPRPKAHTRNRP